jgi:glycosyltransferase involved in cell wall biosynthesis
VVSVVIPAHNEEGVIGRCLEQLLQDAAEGEIEVVVACNGCTDRTAEIARSLGPSVQVVETDVASKPAALNLGDESASAFPRIYLDADIRISTEAVRQVGRVLDDGALAAAPMLRVDLRDRGRMIRAYYRIWTRLPYITEGLIGSGAYGLSREGRSRFDGFPPIIADDGFVSRLFAPQERVSVQTCEFVITPPRSVRSLVSVKTRVFAGNYEHRLRYGPGPQGSNRQGIVRLPPSLWPSLAVYLGIQTIAKLRACWKVAFGELSSWERDDSARAGPLTAA